MRHESGEAVPSVQRLEKYVKQPLVSNSRSQPQFRVIYSTWRAERVSSLYA